MTHETTCSFPPRPCREWRGLRPCGRCARHCETRYGGFCAVPCDGIPANDPHSTIKAGAK